MWKLKTIEAENLCAFRSLSYTLRQGVTTLIFGDNRDNDSQQSNGAGKSALLECIAVGITGSPLRKIRSEEIINDAAEECRVALHFINDSAAGRSASQYQLRQVLRLAMPALRPVLRVALLVITDKDLLDLPATMGTIVRLQQFPEFILPWGRFELDAQVSGWFEPVDRHSIYII